jgi:hypothetical protein
MRSVIGLLVAALFVVSACTSQPRVESELDEFATCLKESGVLMYGSMTCSICAKQRDLFGGSFELLGEIECHPRGENPQTELCLEKDIEKTPTWVVEKDGVEVERLVGFQNLEKLAEISGCSING